ncbi:MAG TPA: Cof-type HAD-IIB family hydrolase [Bacillota bacterium]|nr:Cof-type HAD-IIB family hydrolase [Bacillota bacterium]
MTIRFIAMDLDDTLLTPELTISAENRRAILAAAGHGVKVAIATGRMYQSAKKFAEQFDFDMICLCYNGALIKTSRSGKVLDFNPLKLPAAKRIMTRFMENDLTMNVYFNDQLYQREPTPEGLHYAKMSKVQPVYVGKDLREFLTEAPHKVLGMGDPGKLDKIQPILEKEFAGEVFLTRSKPGYLEALNWGLSKGWALQRLTAKMGISADEVMTIGDAPNDLEMLEWAGVGVAVANAHPDALQAADWVAPDYRENGVAAAIERFVLREGAAS